MPKGYLLLVLHAHLPYVRHPEYDRFLEERWFFEAVTETYIPLIKFFDRLQAERVPFKMTLSISPTLANMMEDPLLRQHCVRHLDLSLSLAEKECERTKDWPDVNALAWMYRRLFEEARHDVRRSLRHAAGDGLPAVRRVGQPRTDHLRRHARLFAAAEFGAERRAAPRSSPPWTNTRASSAASPRACGCPNAPSIRGWMKCSPRPASAISWWTATASSTPSRRRCSASTRRCYCPSGVAAFGRHPMTSKLVWSTSVGYPADYNYREYYRDIGFELDQDYLEPTSTPRASARTPASSITASPAKPRISVCIIRIGRGGGREHAHDFANRCREQARRAGGGMPFPCTIVSPYDAELFGHWWFEGPQWIYHVLRELSQRRRSGAVHAGRIPGGLSGAAAACRRPAVGAATVTASTGSIPRPSGCGVRCTRRRRGCGRRCEHIPAHRWEAWKIALRQAGRELMLAQSSDWPFIITNGTTEQYARRRFHDHMHRFHDLLSRLERRESTRPACKRSNTWMRCFPSSIISCSRRSEASSKVVLSSQTAGVGAS